MLSTHCNICIIYVYSVSPQFQLDLLTCDCFGFGIGFRGLLGTRACTHFKYVAVKRKQQADYYPLHSETKLGLVPHWW